MFVVEFGIIFINDTKYYYWNETDLDCLWSEVNTNRLYRWPLLNRNDWACVAVSKLIYLVYPPSDLCKFISWSEIFIKRRGTRVFMLTTREHS